MFATMTTTNMRKATIIAAAVCGRGRGRWFTVATVANKRGTADGANGEGRIKEI